MRKTTAVLCIAALLPCLLTSCGSSSKNSRVELIKNGKIIEYTVEDFSAPNYDFDELEEFVDDEIESYKSQNEGRIRVTKEKLKKDTAYLTISYNKAETYALFNGEKCFAGTVEESLEEGYDLSMDFLSSDGGDADDEEGEGREEAVQATVSGKQIVKDESLKVFIVGTSAYVTVPGRVKYFCSSAGEAYLESSNTVGISFGEDEISDGNVVCVLYE